MNIPRVASRWALGLAIAIGLAACTVTIVFDPPLAGTVTAQVSTSPSARLSGEQVSGNATVIYRVDVPSARELLYVEAEGSDLRVSLLSSAGTTIGVSTSPTFFAPTVSGLAAPLSSVALDAAVETGAIEASFVCVGPCVATRTSATTYYVRVENRSASTRSFDLFAYTFDHNDTFEPNDTAATATTVAGADSFIGAVELIDDVDWFVYTGTSVRQLTFVEFDPPLGLVLEVDGGPTLEDGESDAIYPGERMRVRSPASLAGPAGASGYVITIGAVVAEAIDGTVSAEATTSPTPRLSGSVGQGQTRTYRVDVPSPRDLLFAEVDGSDLRVTIKTLSGTTLAVSQDPAYFAASVAQAGSDADVVSPSSISVEYVCLGPCVAVAPASSAYLVEVRNLAGSTRAFDFFAYTFDATDANEANDSVASATVLSGAGNYEGAIEILGDVDHFEYDATADGSFFVVFQPFDQALGLELEILDCAECEVLDGTTGFRVEGLLDGDVLRVRSAAGRAGPSATSGYSLQVTATPPGGASVTSR